MTTRYRGPGDAPGEPSPTPPAAPKPKGSTPPAAAAPGFSALDVLRVLGGILLLSTALSYLSTSGTSLTWGYNAWWTRAGEWRALLNGPVSLTDEELRAYDGTDPAKPIYLALNGTIYDVSISPSTYGPGGSYHVFAGRDAARAFLTGCFADDAVPDLRGVETMYIPIDPWEREPGAGVSSEERAKWEEEVRVARAKREGMSRGELKNLWARERREARRKVSEGLEGWHKLFRGEKGKAYRKVGEVRREEGWLAKVPRRELCEQAVKQRPVRKYE